jgi:iron(III) transport system substrate-binding protein
MSRPRLAALVLLLLAVAGATARAPAQDTRVAEARREGKVVWHTALALDSAQRLATRFEQTFPGIKVEVNRSGSERILQRIMQELQAGIKNADVVNTSDTGHYVFFKRQGLLARYTPAGAERLSPLFRDRDGMAWGWRAFPLVIPYNTKQVSAADAPKTWRDLLDPRWKDRLVVAHPGYAGSVITQILALANLYGWDFWTRLAKNRPMLVQSIHDGRSSPASARPASTAPTTACSTPSGAREARSRPRTRATGSCWSSRRRPSRASRPIRPRPGSSPTSSSRARSSR